MAILKPTDIYASIEFLGINDDSADLATTPLNEVNVNFEGFNGDSHSGLTRRSCVRVKKQYPQHTLIRNTRQISALSTEELSDIQTALHLENLNPSWVGANLVIQGIERFSQAPPSSRLIADNGTSLVIDMENAPCKYPGDIIEQHEPGKGAGFAKAAIGKRGVTLWVECEGQLTLGDKLRLHVPPACRWQEQVLGNSN